MSKKKLADRLDWNEMLGFEQITANRTSIRSMSADHRLGAKIGPKPGVKPEIRIGAKSGIKPVIRIGAKIGLKTGSKPTG